MESYLLGVFGHTAMDVILQVDSLPVPNSSIAVKDRVVRHGGTGANIAKCSADLGVDTRLASFVGRDFPEDYKRSLEESGVNIEDLLILDDEDTPTCWIVTDRKEEQMAFIDQGAMECSPEHEVQKKTVKRSDIIHIGTGRPEYYEKVMRDAKGKKTAIGFDPAQELRYVYDEETFLRLLGMSDYFFCNENEYRTALEYLSGDGVQDILDHVDTLIVTRGRQGSSIYTEEECIDIPAFKPKKIVDPTGAGDAYRAGFYAGLTRDLSLEEAGRAASSRASFSLEYDGPQEEKIVWEDVLNRVNEQTA